MLYVLALQDVASEVLLDKPTSLICIAGRWESCISSLCADERLYL